MNTFIVELIKRFAADTPWFFRIVRYVSISIAVVMGLPGVIDYLCTEADLCLVLPESWSAIYSKAVSIAALASAFIAQLTATTTEKAKQYLAD